MTVVRAATYGLPTCLPHAENDQIYSVCGNKRAPVVSEVTSESGPAWRAQR